MAASTFKNPHTDSSTIYNKFKSKEYYKEHDRLSSFYGSSKWPLTFIDPAELALTGFYYIGERDRVKCYFCGIQLCNWQRTDSPIKEHEKWSPSCPLLRRRTTNNIPIDEKRLDNILPPLSYDECGSGSFYSNQVYPNSSVTTESSSYEYNTEHDRISSFSDWPGAMKQTPKQMSDAGFFYTGYGDRVKCFKCGEEIKNWLENDDPWEKHVQAAKDCPYIMLVKGEEFIKSTLAKLADIKKIEENSAKKLLPHIEDEQNLASKGGDNICKICFNNDRETIFLPCSHIVACAKCASSVSVCPVCRKKFDKVQRIYFS